MAEARGHAGGGPDAPDFSRTPGWRLSPTLSRLGPFRASLSSSSSAGSAMAAVKTLNPKAEVARAQAALAVNISAARGLQDVLRTNLGPKGTMKM